LDIGVTGGLQVRCCAALLYSFALFANSISERACTSAQQPQLLFGKFLAVTFCVNTLMYKSSRIKPLFKCFRTYLCRCMGHAKQCFRNALLSSF